MAATAAAHGGYGRRAYFGCPRCRAPKDSGCPADGDLRAEKPFYSRMPNPKEMRK
jgi:hypothetical protein